MLFSKRVGTSGGVTKIVFHCMIQISISRHYENYIVCYNVTLQHTALHCNRHIESPRMFCNRGCGTTPLHITAAHCNSLQPVVTRCSTLQHTAAHCNTLQHTATPCNTLQHTATNLLSRPGWFEGECAAQVFLAPAIDGHKYLRSIMDDFRIWVMSYGVATISCGVATMSRLL